jgi:hypothetical protein
MLWRLLLLVLLLVLVLLFEALYLDVSSPAITITLAVHLYMLVVMVRVGVVVVVVVVVVDWAHRTEVVTVAASLFALKAAGCAGSDRARSSGRRGHGGKCGGEGEG